MCSRPSLASSESSMLSACYERQSWGDNSHLVVCRCILRDWFDCLWLPFRKISAHQKKRSEAGFKLYDIQWHSDPAYFSRCDTIESSLYTMSGSGYSLAHNPMSICEWHRSAQNVHG